MRTLYCCYLMYCNFSRYFLLILLTFSQLGSYGVEIDNQIVGMPLASCQNEMLMLTFKTAKPFTGRVYVKGMLDRPECSATFVHNLDKTEFSMMIHRGDCGMRKKDEGNGQVMYSVVFVVSHHGTFVTKADRAYRTTCEHRQSKHVSEAINLSGIGTTELVGEVMPRQPNCAYSIHSQKRDGPVISFAGIGDKIYHVWHCDDPNFGFLVHSCSVDDGRGERFDLLDPDGCAIDPVIQPEVMYDESFQLAHVETHGYKFSGTSSLQYRCVLEFCRKGTAECTGTVPPQCGRGKRSVKYPKEVSTINPDNPETGNPESENPENSQGRISVEVHLEVIDTLTTGDEGISEVLASVNESGNRDLASSDYCITNYEFATVLLLDIVFLLILTTVVANCLIRRKSVLKNDYCK